MKALARVGHHSFARFAVFGVLGLGFDVSLLAVLAAHTALAQTAAITIAFGTTYLLNFFLNRRFSFAAAGSKSSTTEDGVPGRLGGQLARFAPQVGLDFVLTLSAVDLLTNLGTALLVARVLPGAVTRRSITRCTAGGPSGRGDPGCRPRQQRRRRPPRLVRQPSWVHVPFTDRCSGCHGLVAMTWSDWAA